MWDDVLQRSFSHAEPNVAQPFGYCGPGVGTSAENVNIRHAFSIELLLSR